MAHSVYYLTYCGCQAGGDGGEYHVKNYVVPSGGYRRRGGATSSGAQLNITNYNLPITVSYLNYLKQRKVCLFLQLCLVQCCALPMLYVYIVELSWFYIPRQDIIGHL